MSTSSSQNINIGDYYSKILKYFISILNTSTAKCSKSYHNVFSIKYFVNLNIKDKFSLINEIR